MVCFKNWGRAVECRFHQVYISKRILWLQCENWKGLDEAMVDVGRGVEKLRWPREVIVAWIGGVAADIEGS